VQASIGIVLACLAALGLIFPGGAAAAGRAPAPAAPVALALRTIGEPTAESWRSAPAITEFRQRAPNDGAAPTFRTEARVAYDESHLHVTIVAFDPDPSRIVGHRTRRDEYSPSDWVRVLVDSFHDHRTAFEFAVNPAGVKQDRYWFNDGNSDTGWDAVWDVTVTRTGDGWSARFDIPFSQLRFHPSAQASFGLAIVRDVARLNETVTWPLLSRSAPGYVSSFGSVDGLNLAGSQKRLELLPYTVARVETRQATAGNPLEHNADPDASIGLDLKYAISPGLTLTATMNPDFGQVEADPAVVNLSAFETFFEEKRPFFLEGSGIFRFDTDCNDGACSGLFYSRRIGRAPRGSATVAEGGFSAAPAQTTVLGAAKVTGRVGAFSIGAMNAVTGNEHAVIAEGTSRHEQLVEPLTSYSVARGRREFGDQSSLGFMVTATNRRDSAETAFLAEQAYTGGVDWDWRVGKRYAVQGFWAGSSVHGDAGAIGALQTNAVHLYQRPDSTALEYDPDATALSGQSAQIAFNQIAGEHLRFSSIAAVKTPGFEVNDVGFLQRADQKAMTNWLQWRNERPSKLFRSWRYNLNQWASWNFDGDRLVSGANVNAHAQFRNNWFTGMGLTVNWRGFDDRATRGGPGAYKNSQTSVWGYIETDERRTVSAGINVFRSNDFHGTTYHDFSPSLTYRPSSFLAIQGGLNFTTNRDQSQWIGTEDGEYVFGRLDQHTVALTTRVNYTLTPRLSIQVYAQPFVSAGDYSNFKALVDGRAEDYEARYAPYAYTGNPDFNYRSFRTTNVLRWEYRPGSTLFVVWQQGRETVAGYGEFDFSRDFGRVFSAPAVNVFLVKMAYWINR
jgi:hypothetical protein